MTDLIGRWWKWVAGVLAVMVGALWGRAKIAERRADRAEDRAAEGEAYRKTRERIDDAKTTDGDAAAARDRLRARGQR